MVAIKPIPLIGNWVEGFALDIHSTGSDYLGDDEWGHPQFNTHRSELGELLFRLKYRSNRLVLDEIVVTVVDFLTKQWQIAGKIDFLVPIPPSRARAFQPVPEIAKMVGAQLNLEVMVDALAKKRDTPELKDSPADERRAIVANVFEANEARLKGKTVLLMDDLYSSGATITEATRALYQTGGVLKVYVLTLTKTKG